MTGTILSDLEIFAHFFIVGLEVEKGTADGHHGSFWDDGNDYIVIYGQLCKFTKNHWMINLK